MSERVSSQIAAVTLSKRYVLSGLGDGEVSGMSRRLARVLSAGNLGIRWGMQTDLREMDDPLRCGPGARRSALSWSVVVAVVWRHGGRRLEKVCARNGVGGINPRCDWAWRAWRARLARVLPLPWPVGDSWWPGGGGGSHDDGPNRSGSDIPRRARGRVGESRRPGSQAASAARRPGARAK